MQERSINISCALKGRLPFALGTTSYIIPDDILPNVRYLADKVDDIQLVLFESDEMSNMPDSTTLDELKRLADRHGLTYTVHLPLDTILGDPDDAVRSASVGKCARVIELTGMLDPFAWIVHLHGEKRGDTPSDDVAAWSDRSRDSIERILATGVAPRRLCVETLDYPFELVDHIVEEYDTSVCVDVGHLLLARRDVLACMNRYADRLRVVHLHGIVDDKDHRGADRLDAGLLNGICRALSVADGVERVVTLEVFSKEDLASSLEAIGGLGL